MKTVKKASGMYPMVIETPLNVIAGGYMSKALLEYNKNLIERKAMGDFLKETKNIDSNNILETLEETAKKALTFRI